MKRLLAWLCVLFGVAALIVSTSRSIMHSIAAARDVSDYTPWWAIQHSDWGDLVGMSYLDDVPKFREAKRYNFGKADTCDKTVDLYQWGDSYLQDVPDSVYRHVSAYHFLFRNDSFTFKLDTTKRNILIIESAERFVRSKFRDTGFINYLNIACAESRSQNPDIGLVKYPVRHIATASVLPDFNIDDLFNKKINQNLEYNLFNYNFLKRPRLLKADINYYSFNRASGDVAVSDNGQYLFFKPTITNPDVASSYESVNTRQIDSIVNSLNKIYIHYKRAGFSEIYLGIIPNPASILQPEGYNDLIPLVQGHPALKMRVIDLYSVFKQHKKPATLYRAGDTHWNDNGMKIWLEKVNKIMDEEATKLTNM